MRAAVFDRQSRVNEATTEGTEAKLGHGRFFTVDSRIWPQVCGLGMNAAIAYLVLACGTDKKMALTKWSVNAIETYTGISRMRSAAALRLLMDKGFVAPAGGTWNAPRYKILAPAE